MIVNKNSFIRLTLEDSLFERTTAFSFGCSQLAIIDGKKESGTPTLTYVKKAIISYTPQTSKGDAQLVITRLVGTRQRRVALFEKDNTSLVMLQGEVTSIASSITIDEAEPVDLGDREIAIPGVVGADLFYNGIKVVYDLIESVPERETVIFNINKHLGYTYRNVFIRIALDVRAIGYENSREFVAIPYETSDGNRTLRIPSCCIFETLIEGAESPTSMIIMLNETITEGYYTEIARQPVIIKDGFTIKEEMNETLDSGVIQFVSTITQTDVEQFDTLTVEYDELGFERKKQLVDTFDTKVVEFNDLDIFESEVEFTITLFSETKMLERIDCPNLTITRRTENPKTVYQKVLEYCYMYLPRICVYTEDGGVEETECLKIDDTLKEKLDVECPELHWNSPTLREVLTDLFAVAKLIPIVKDNVLTYFDLNRRGNEIDKSKLTDFTLEGVSSDYCDEIYLPMNNVIQENATHVVEFATAKAESERFGDTNIVFATSKPINRIISVKVYAKIHDRRPQHGTYYVKPYDITDLVLEKSSYDTLSTDVRGGIIKDNQKFHLYFERGQRNIKNINEATDYKQSGITRTLTKINWVICAKIALDEGREGIGTQGDFYQIEDGANCICLIEYEAIDETTVAVGRSNKIKNQNNRVFDGQSSSIVDAKRQVEQEQSKVNRFGSKVFTIFGAYKTEKEVPQLSDTLGDYVLYSRELQYFDDIILFKGRLCKNYVLQNYFAGIQNEKRIFQLVQNNEATTRHENIKFYVYACLDKDVNQYNAQEYGVFKMNIAQNVISRTLESTSLVASTYTLKHCLFQNDAIIDIFNDTDGNYELDINHSILGMSYVCDFGFYDNYIAGDGVGVDDDEKYAIPYAYADSNGEFNNVFISLFNRMDYKAGDDYLRTKLAELEEEKVASEFDEEKYNSVMNATRRKPYVTFDEANYDNNYLRVYADHFFKDNSERMKFTLQFEVLSGSDELFIKDKFMSTFRLFTKDTKTYYVYVAKNTKYREHDSVAKGTLRSDITLKFNDLTTEPELDYVELVGDTGLNENDCWCIADSDKNIVIAVNGSAKRVNFEFRGIRDNNVYNNIIDRNPIGTLANDPTELAQAYRTHPAYVKFISVMGRTIDVKNVKGIYDELLDYDENY